MPQTAEIAGDRFILTALQNMRAPQKGRNEPSSLDSSSSSSSNWTSSWTKMLKTKNKIKKCKITEKRFGSIVKKE